MAAQTLLAKDVYCQNFDTNVTANAAKVLPILFTTAGACVVGSYAYNDARSLLADYYVTLPRGLLCGSADDFVYSQHEAWRYGAWRSTATASPAQSFS